MKTINWKSISKFCLPVFFLAVGHIPTRGEEQTWKAGTAKAVITPKEPIWMAGYSSRTSPANGTMHDLYVRVLVLEDADRKRAVVVSTDLLGIPKSIADNVCAALKKKFGLSRSQIMLNASHTHCGPVLRSALYDAYPIDEAQKKRIEAYSAELEGMIVRTIGEALSMLVPATVSTGLGSAEFAVNRRENREPDVPTLQEQHALRGPVDHSVPVLAVRGRDGTLSAVVFGYACHNTTLSISQWNGDYAGFAETNLEQAHPGAVALFFMGCGGDQNPLPRRTIDLCKAYGKQLSDVVNGVLSRPMEVLSPVLCTRFETVPLKLGVAPSPERLKSLARGRESYVTRWAKRSMKERDEKAPQARVYPYPVEAWLLGKRQLWISLGGEVVVDFALRFKERYGAQTWVGAYANDVMAYIPSRRVLHEDLLRTGGYEGNTSMIVYGMPAERWDESVEEAIAATVDRVIQQLKDCEANSDLRPAKTPQ